ncbi:MAG: nickel-type superoxide dismutase maturation protease [Ardenticatenaceae bacterium]|nr:nickel-type superoxide dismutase maturation protease [Ardenticatenaceae bacterium]MCB9446166.1 nickel-type superoxide dismutase maturation protease [Ardenticatenaceae bacterium]
MQESNLRELFLWLIRLRRRYRVTGASMFPLMEAGDEVLVDPRAYRQQQPQIGDVVVAQHPVQANLQIIKRVAEVMGDGRFHLKGDNTAESSDSLVPPNLILGRVTSKFG